MSNPDEAPHGSPILPLPRKGRGFQPSPIAPGPTPFQFEPVTPLPGQHMASVAMPDHVDEHDQRRPLSDEEMAAPLGLRNSASAELPPVWPPNKRRSSHTLKVFLITMFIMLDCFALFAWALYVYYQDNLEPRLNAASVAAQSAATPQAVESLKAAQTAADTTIAKLQAQIEGLRADLRTAGRATMVADASPQLSVADAQIDRMQSQITTLRNQQTEAEAVLKKLQTPAPKTDDPKAVAALEQVASLKAQYDTLAKQFSAAEEKLNKKEAPAPATKTDANESPSGNAIGSIVSVTSDVGQELRILKERNRLTLFADQALAVASSKAMANLWQAVRDPQLAFVKDGAVAEIVRVQHFYSTMPGLPPSYRLPVDKLFKDGAIKSEADLKNEQIIELLLDEKQPAEIRARCAMMLAGHSDTKVGDALMNAMRRDASLLVVKAAQNAMQDSFELYAPRLFDTVSMDKDWQAWKIKHEDKPANKK